MKWDNDEYKDIKLRFMEDVVDTLNPDLAAKVSIRNLTDAIDHLFETLKKLGQSKLSHETLSCDSASEASESPTLH